jgi:hypothetical protein
MAPSWLLESLDMRKIKQPQRKPLAVQSMAAMRLNRKCWLSVLSKKTERGRYERRSKGRTVIRLLFALLLLLVVKQPILAQDSHPRVEIFGGFSYLPAGRADFPRKDSYGFQTSLCGNVNRWLGAVADFGGQYRKVSDLGPGYPGVTANTSVYEYMAGPRFALRRERFTFFSHALVGRAAGRSGLAGFSDSQFAFAGGGGLDIDLGGRLALRVLQLDYIGSFTDILEDNARLAFGVVIRLGR